MKRNVKMNAITTNTASTALGALRSLKATIDNVQQTIVNKSANPYLRLGRDGKWIYGAENIEVEDGSLWAANPLGIEHGWVAWNREKGADNSGGPIAEVMVAGGQACPPKDTLRDVGHDWDYQMSIPLMCLNGTDKGEQVLYKANSVGGIDALDGLIKAIGNQISADEAKPVPVVSLGSGSYNHKKWGKTYTPELNIVEWVPLAEQMPTMADPAPKAEVEAAKPRTRSVPATTAKAAPAEQPAGDDDDAELLELQRKIAEKKAAKEAAAKAVDPDMTRALSAEEAAAIKKEAARAKLLAEMAALDADDAPQAADPAPAAAGAPMKRRRS